MPALLKELKDHLGPAQIELIGQKLNTTSMSARNGLNLVLPILIGGMAGKALDETKVKQLYQALTADHNGSIFDNLTRFLSSHDFHSKNGILPYLLEDRQSMVTHMVNEKSGLGEDLINQVMELSSVLLMGIVGKELRHHDYDTEGLTVFLQRASNQIAKNSPELYGKLNILFQLEPAPKKKKFSFLSRKKK